MLTVRHMSSQIQVINKDKWSLRIYDWISLVFEQNSYLFITNLKFVGFKHLKFLSI